MALVMVQLKDRKRLKTKMEHRQERKVLGLLIQMLLTMVQNSLKTVQKSHQLMVLQKMKTKQKTIQKITHPLNQ